MLQWLWQWKFSGFRCREIGSLFFWDVTRRRLVVGYRRFGTSKSHLLDPMLPRNVDNELPTYASQYPKRHLILGSQYSLPYPWQSRLAVTYPWQSRLAATYPWQSRLAATYPWQSRLAATYPWQHSYVQQITDRISFVLLAQTTPSNDSMLTVYIRLIAEKYK